MQAFAQQRKPYTKQKDSLHWEKIFENDATNKGLISKIQKQLIQLNNDKTQRIQLKNGQNKRNISPQKTYRCSTLLAIREKQIKTTMK